MATACNLRYIGSMQIISRKDARTKGLKQYFTGQACKHGHVAPRLVSTFTCIVCSVEHSKAWQKNKRREDPAWRDAQREKVRAYQQQPSARVARNTRQRERLATDPEFRAAYYAAKRKRRSRPEYAAVERAKNLARFIKKYRNDPDFRREADRKSRERQARPEVRKALSERNRVRYATDETYRTERLEYQRLRRSSPSVKKQRLDEHRRRMSTRRGREVARSAGRNYRARSKAAEGFHTADDIEAILVRQNFRCNYCSTDISGQNRHIDHIKPLAKGGSNWPNNLQGLCAPCNFRKRDTDAEEFEKRVGAPSCQQ